MDLTFITKYLTKTLLNAGLKDMGKTKKTDEDTGKSYLVEHDKVNSRIEAEIVNRIERYIYGGHDGDKVPEYFRVDESGRIMCFNGKCYEMLNEDKNSDDMDKLIRSILIGCKVGIVYQVNSYHKIAKLCKLGIRTKCQKFNLDRRYLCFENGILDLQTMKLNDFDTKYHTDIVFDFNYDASVTSPLWNEFISTVIPDKATRRALMQFCGAFFIDRKLFRIEQMCFLVGEKAANGKTTFMNALKGLIKKNITVFEPYQLLTGSHVQQNIATANGKLANISDDAGTQDISGGTMKALISGSEMQARYLYQESFIATQMPLLMAGVNAMPICGDDTNGYHRRILAIPMNQTIPEEKRDRELDRKLSTPEVKMAMLNEILKAREEVIANFGVIEIGAEIIEKQKELKNNSNSTRRWLFEEMEYIPIQIPNKDPRFRPTKDYFDAYTTWCNENGVKARRDMGGFSKLLKQEGFAMCKMGANVSHCYLGTKEDIGEQSSKLDIELRKSMQIELGDIDEQVAMANQVEDFDTLPF